MADGHERETRHRCAGSRQAVRRRGRRRATCRSASSGARSSASSARTVPARPRPWRRSAVCGPRTAARSPCSGSTRDATGSSCTSGSACSCSRASCPDKIRVHEAVELYASFYRSPADPGELIDVLGLGAEAEGDVRQALRRPAAAALDRTRSGRQPRDRDLGRADDRPRPAGSPRHLAARGAGAGPWGDGGARHALHGRGRAAVRPGRRDRPRSRGRTRHAGRIGQRGECRPADPLPAVGRRRAEPPARAARGVRRDDRGPASS